MNSGKLVEILGTIIENKGSAKWRYTLSDDAVIPIPRNLTPPGEVILPWASITQDAAGHWELRVRKGYSWDGCTAASDFSDGVKGLQDVLRILHESDKAALQAAGPLLGSIAHDSAYQFIDKIAAAWGRPVSEVRKWADLLFAAVMAGSDVPYGQVNRYFWAVRIAGGVFNWFGRARSRIPLNPLRWFGVLVVAGCLLAQGCATSAWHNYQVAQAEQSERDQLDAGKIPLVKTNADLIRDNWFGYVVGIALDAGAAYCVYRYVERDDRETTVHTTYNDNRVLPEPVEDDAGDIAP